MYISWMAEACRSVAMAMRKCPNGMYAEIKYDGERVQVHKQGNNFQYFSRSLKAVQPHKVEHIKDYLPKACPHGDSMILDCEVLMVDTKTGKPLPFGTLGIHKKTAFKDACCCLFIFDLIYFNGETLMDKPISERRQLLEKNIKVVDNRIMLSEQSLIKHEDDRSLSDLIMSVIKQGLEGLVLKDVRSIYEPGKRHWLKVKKDYLLGGAMADTADLIVLGAYYGTGNKGGMMSVFLMGVYDKSSDKFRTVAKCGNGHDDATLAKLQKELKMVKISKDMSKVPAWLLVNKTVIPDLVVKDPKASPVWEITGAEFSSSNIHTAGGISIRFPRVTRIRDDKDWTNATDLDRLKVLFKKSKENTDIPGLSAAAPAAKDEGGDEEEEDDAMYVDASDGVTTGSGRAATGSDAGGVTGSSSNESVTTGSSSGGVAASPRGKKRKREGETATVTPTKKDSTGSSSGGVALPSRGQKRKREGGATPTKKAEGDSGASPSKKQKVECKFGPKCYQKSRQHKEQFLHPWDTEGAVECAGVTVDNPLPNIFSGVKIYILPGVAKEAELKRYFITYDGEVLGEHEKSQATYLISPSSAKKTGGDTSIRCLKVDWIWDSLEYKQQMPIQKYLIK